MPKGPQKKISADFTDLENQAPGEEGGLIPSTPEGHLKKGIGAVEADARDGLRRVEPGLAPGHHPPCLFASHMQGLNDGGIQGSAPSPSPQLGSLPPQENIPSPQARKSLAV